jgi:UDP-glucose 4-epimerase
MKLCVTGGAGYIGSIVVERLLTRGDEVTIVDNLSTGHRDAVPEGCRFVEGDIRSETVLEEAFSAGTDAVVHFAASSIVSDSVKKPLDYFDNNVYGAITLLKAIKKHGVGGIIFSSSAAVYGSPAALPIEETAPLMPDSPYGTTKMVIERILESCGVAWGLNHFSLRYFNAGGGTASRGEDHRPESHLIPIVLEVALGKRDRLQVFGDDYDTPDGTCVRDYIHVVDLAEAHILALDALGKDVSGALNLGSEKPHSVLEVIRTAEKITGSSIPFNVTIRRPGDPPALLASSKRAESLLGWKKTHSTLEEIISTAYQWRLAHANGYLR